MDRYSAPARRLHAAPRSTSRLLPRYMKIQSITVYQVDLPLHEGSYKWSGGKSVEVFDSDDRTASRPTRASRMLRARSVP